MTAELEREFSIELRTWLSQPLIERFEPDVPASEPQLLTMVSAPMPRPQNLWSEFWMLRDLRRRSQERLTMWSAETESSKRYAMQVVAVHEHSKAFLRSLSSKQNWQLLFSVLRGERVYFLNLWLLIKMMDSVVQQINTKLFAEYGGQWFAHLRMVSDPGAKEDLIRRKEAYARGEYVEFTGDQLRERARRCSE